MAISIYVSLINCGSLRTDSSSVIRPVQILRDSFLSLLSLFGSIGWFGSPVIARRLLKSPARQAQQLDPLQALTALTHAFRSFAMSLRDRSLSNFNATNVMTAEIKM